MSLLSKFKKNNFPQANGANGEMWKKRPTTGEKRRI